MKVWDAPTDPDQMEAEVGSISSSSPAIREYHASEAEAAEANHQMFAAVFHLDRLLSLLADRRRASSQRRQRCPGRALTAAPIRRLGGSRPGAPGDQRSRYRARPQGCSACPSRSGEARRRRLTHRLHGRPCCARIGEAALPLTRPWRSGPDAPPVEELLLAPGPRPAGPACRGEQAPSSSRRVDAARSAGTVQAVCLTGLA